MNKKITIFIGIIVLIIISYFKIIKNTTESQSLNILEFKEQKFKKSINEKMLNIKEREQHEFLFQANPITEEIPMDEKKMELEEAFSQKQILRKSNSNSYISRGPSNLGGRTRSIAVDLSDSSGNTLLAGGVSSGVFKTINGGGSWMKVSSNNEIHNVTTISQDPRPGFQNIWYYGTGERSGNSASLGSAFRGKGVWKSTDSGETWSLIPFTSSNFTLYDSPFDYVNRIVVSPINGDVFIATIGKVYRYDGSQFYTEMESSIGIDNLWTDVCVTSTGRVFVAIEGNTKFSGVSTSVNGVGSWNKIASSDSPTGWRANGRIVLGIAPSNDNIIYALYNNGQNGVEADLWKYDHSNTTWTDFSSKLPDEPGRDLSGNDPFAIQGGYDLVVSVKPDDENHLFIGGTNAYEIKNILDDNMFSRIGGYLNNQGYSIYDRGGVEHHPDVHFFTFDNISPNIMYSGTDGGVHKLELENNEFRIWTNLNNFYQTYQYYHIALDPANNSDIVIGGAQDNGTTLGGMQAGFADSSFMQRIAGGDGAGVAVGGPQNSSPLPLLYLSTQQGPIYRRTSGYSEITPNGSSSQFVTYFHLDPDNTNALYYAGNSNLYITNDAINVTSNNWTNTNSLPTSELIRTLATTRGEYDSNNSFLFIGGNSGGIFRLKDPQNETNASNAVNITPIDASKNPNTIVSGISVHPTNPDVVLVVYSNYGIKNIFLSENATDDNPTWTLVERNLESYSIRSVAIAEVNGQTQYFVGTARGLYKTIDPINSDWIIEGQNTIGLALVSQLVYRPSDNKLLVGTHGNGMYETTLNSTLSIDEFKFEEIKLTIYPNPVQRLLKVKSNDIILDNTNFVIYDIRGAKVLNGKLINNSINVSKLKKGVYIIDFKNKNRKVVKKFIKE